MTARVVSLEIHKARRQRADKGAAGKAEDHCQPIERVDHFARLQRQFEASRDLDDTARIYCAVETYFGRDFPQAAAATANLHLSAWATAIAYAAAILNQSQRLLSHAFLTANNLGRGDQKCRIATERTSKQQTAEQLGEGA